MNKKTEKQETSDSCPCPVWGCPYRCNCRDGTKTHLEKGHLNACGFYTILPVVNKLLEEIDDPKAKELIRERLLNPNEKAYELCRSMQDDMPLSELIEYLTSPVEGLRCNAHESLKKRTGKNADYDPMGKPEEMEKGKKEWMKAIGD